MAYRTLYYRNENGNKVGRYFIFDTQAEMLTDTLIIGDQAYAQDTQNYFVADSETSFVQVGGVSGGTGTVTSVSVTTSNGVSGSVATPTTTPAITLSLGAITPSAITISSFTASRPIFTTTGGQFTYDDNLTYDGFTHACRQYAAFSASGQPYIYAFPQNDLTKYVQISHDGTYGYVKTIPGGTIVFPQTIAQTNVLESGGSLQGIWIAQTCSSGTVGGSGISLWQQTLSKDLTNWLTGNGFFQYMTGDKWLGIHLHQDATSDKSTGLVLGIHGTGQSGIFAAVDGTTAYLERAFVYVTGSNPIHEININRIFTTTDPSAAGTSSGTSYTGKVWRLLDDAVEKYYVDYTGSISLAAGAHAITASSVVFNENSIDMDIRFESNGDANNLFSDGGADRVGIGTGTPGSKLDVVGSFQCDSITNDTGLAHGTYTPTLTSVANVNGTPTVYDANYLRVGNTVTVSGKTNIDPTLISTVTQLGISLPVASDLTANEQCAGLASNGAFSAYIYGDATNNRAELLFVSTGTDAQDWYFTFTYRIL